MATELKGSAVGTLGTTPEERVIKEGTDLAQKLQAMFPLPKQSSVDVQGYFQPLLDQIAGQAGPQPLPVPDTRLNASTALGLFASNVGAQLTRQPSKAFDVLLGRQQQAQEIERRNVDAQNVFEQNRQLQFLTTRRDILQAAFDQAIGEQKYEQASKIQERQFVINTGLERLQSVRHAAQTQALARLEAQGRLDVAKVSGILDFLSSRAGASGLSMGQRTSLSPSDESSAIFKLIESTNAIDLKLQPDGGVWTFGKKVPTDEELGAQLRTMGAALSLPSQNVRDLGLDMIKGVLQARYGDNTDAKIKFLQSQGLSILAPTTQTGPPTAPPTPTDQASAAPADATRR